MPNIACYFFKPLTMSRLMIAVIKWASEESSLTLPFLKKKLTRLTFYIYYGICLSVVVLLILILKAFTGW